jgi:hypothetical protein
MKRRRDEETLVNNKAPGHPTLPLQGFEQPGLKGMTCYGCGEAGHRRGDAKCAAGPKDVWSGALDSFKELVKKRGSEFLKRKFNGDKRDGAKQRNVKPEDVEKGICFNFSRGNGYCKYGDACKLKHEGPKGGGGGGKRKAALIAPKGILKKKGKEKKKKAVKSFASMVVKDMRELLQNEQSGDEAGSKEGERSDGGDDSLFKLVRETSAKKKKKRKVNFIVTLAGAGHDYVPSRWSSLMLTDREDKEKYVPQRPNQLGDDQAAASAKRERSVSNEDFEVDKGKSPPAEEAIAVITTEGAKPRQKRKKTRKSKAGKSEVRPFQEEKASAPSDWGESNPSIPDWGKSTPLTCDSAEATPVHNPGASAQESVRPTWGTMKDYSEDDRVDRKWGDWRKDAERKARDDKMRGRSLPPKGKAESSERMCEGGAWGGTGAKSAPGWGSPRKGSPERDSCRPVGQESSSKSPEEPPKTKRPWNRTRREVRGSGTTSGTKGPKLSSEKEESTFLVRVKKGETKAKVLFLNNEKSTGWEEPFDMSLTMDDMMEFNTRPAPRAHTWPASVRESESSSGEEESGGSERSERVKSPLFEKGLDPHLEGERGAGYLELVEIAKKSGTGYRALIAEEKLTQAEWEAIMQRAKRQKQRESCALLCCLASHLKSKQRSPRLPLSARHPRLKRWLLLPLLAIPYARVWDLSCLFSSFPFLSFLFLLSSRLAFF